MQGIYCSVDLYNFTRFFFAVLALCTMEAWPSFYVWVASTFVFPFLSGVLQVFLAVLSQAVGGGSGNRWFLYLSDPACM